MTKQPVFIGVAPVFKWSPTAQVFERWDTDTATGERFLANVYPVDVFMEKNANVGSALQAFETWQAGNADNIEKLE